MRNLLSIGFLLFATFSAHAATSIEQSCQFRAAFASGGKIKPTDVAKDLFAWNSTMTPETVGSALAVLDTFSLDEAQVYKVTEVGRFYELHLVAGANADGGPIFALLKYLLVKGETRLANIQFQDSLEKLMPSVHSIGVLPGIEC